MVKKIRLLGMVIDNFSLHEEMQIGEGFYNRSEMNIIRTVSMKMLGMAADLRAVRDGIGQADLLIIGDKEILTEAGIYSGQRLREAAGHGFMQEYFAHMCRNGRRVFLVANVRQELELLQDYLRSAYETMWIVGCYAIEDCGGEYDSMINEINAAMPDALVSVVDSPKEDEFLLQAKAKISAKVWYSIGKQYREPYEKMSFLFRFRQLLHKGRFKSLIHHYDDEHQWERSRGQR